MEIHMLVPAAHQEIVQILIEVLPEMQEHLLVQEQLAK
jgi:hypothetical protein